MKLYERRTEHSQCLAFARDPAELATVLSESDMKGDAAALEQWRELPPDERVTVPYPSDGDNEVMRTFDAAAWCASKGEPGGPGLFFVRWR